MGGFCKMACCSHREALALEHSSISEEMVSTAIWISVVKHLHVGVLKAKGPKNIAHDPSMSAAKTRELL